MTTTIFLDTLKYWKSELNRKVCAFCLISNHIHLLLDTGVQPENISLLMKLLADRLTLYVNRQEGRTAALREGR